MKEKRRKFSPSQKVSIVREHLEGGYSLSSLCEKYQIHPTQLTRWKKQLFEGGIAIFSGVHAKRHDRFEKEVDALKSRLSHKDGIIAELLEDNLRLKKNDGDY
jgi:transposase